MTQNEKELKVLELRKCGWSYGKISKELGLSKALVAYYSKRNTIESAIEKNKIKEKAQKEYEQIVCENVKKANSMCDLCKLMGKRPTNTNYLHFTKIIEKYNIDVSHFSSLPVQRVKPQKISDSEYFVCDKISLKSSFNVKRRILKSGIKEYKCECCGRVQWNGDLIPLELHHINGDRYDNRLENLQLLCPNCHAQTDTYAGKNIKFKKQTLVCRCCGKEFYFGEGASKCSKIYCSVECRDKISEENKQYIKNKKDENLHPIKKPTENELIESYKELGSFKKIGEKYNVSDNAVKKWFISYKLPSKVRDIRSFIMEKYGEQPQWYSYRYNENGYMKNVAYKKIDAYTKDNIFLKTYDNIHEVMKDLNLKTENLIRRVCNNKYSSYCGYVFKYHVD